MTWGRKGSEGSVWLPHSIHSHSWSGREENGYWFPGLSLCNCLLNVSFWERNMCLVSPWELCLGVSRVLAKRQSILLSFRASGRLCWALLGEGSAHRWEGKLHHWFEGERQSRNKWPIFFSFEGSKNSQMPPGAGLEIVSINTIMKHLEKGELWGGKICWGEQLGKT